MELKILTQNEKYIPVLLSGLSWETSRQSSPGVLKFRILADDDMIINEGDKVLCSEDGTDFFLGYIFTIKKSKEPVLEITAYDQLRYFKNKDTLIYKTSTADQLLKTIADICGLEVGKSDSTGVSLSRVEDDAEYFDMMNNAISETLLATGELYVLWDDIGKLRLSNIKSLRTSLLIREDSAENYSYQSSIDSETFNQIKLVYEKDGVKQYYIVKDSNSINKYGFLQKYEKIDDDKVGSAKTQAERMLKLYNAPVKTLEIKNVFGDIEVRAGTSVIFEKEVDGETKYNYMLVEYAKHTWNNGTHLMSIKLKGGDING